MRLGWLVVSFPIHQHPREQFDVHDQIDRDRLVMVWCLHRVEWLGVLVAGVWTADPASPSGSGQHRRDSCGPRR